MSIDKPNFYSPMSHKWHGFWRKIEEILEFIETIQAPLGAGQSKEWREM